MEENVEVSVIIPAHDCAGYISRAIDSVYDQGISCEIIVIDDASSDDLMRVLAPYRKDPLLRVISNKQNYGAAASRNIGISVVRGHYTAFLDADDYWLPGKIQRQLSLMKKTGSVMSYTGRRFYVAGRRIAFSLKPPSKISLARLMRCNYLTCSSILVNTDVIRRFLFDPDPSIHEDYACWIRILKEYGTISGLTDVYTIYNYRAGGRSSNKVKSSAMRANTYRKVGCSSWETWIRSIFYYFHWVFQIRPERIHFHE